MLCLQSISYTYPQSERPALVQISQTITEGEFLAVMGRNGSGKSTLARLLNGMLIPDTGQVIVDNIRTSDRENLIKIRQKVGLLLPSPDNQIIFNLVEEDVAFGPENLGLPTNEIRDRVDTALQMVSMEEFKKHPPYLLSGGQKQKVALAGLLAMQPKYLVLDEPTAMLDSPSKQDIMDRIKSINKEKNMSIILITHDIDEAIHADKIILLDEGSIKATIKPVDLYKYAEELKNAGVGLLDVMDLVLKLEKETEKRLGLSPNILCVDELVEELCRLR